MASKLQFLVFPAEILIMVLQNLRYKDLIASSMVCKRFHKLVKEAVVLVYIVELGVDGLADGPPSDLSTSERLRLLLDLRKRWRTFDWVKRERIQPYPMKLKQGNHIHYAQGIFSQELYCGSEGHETSIFHTMLPTRVTEAAEYGSLIDLRSYWLFCMDPAADVVIFVQIEDEVTPDLESEEICLMFAPRSLNSCHDNPHRLCQTDTIELFGVDYGGGPSDPQIAGDMTGIAIAAGNGEDSGSLVIYNWHTGELVAQMTRFNSNSSWLIRDFTFLSPQSFVLYAALWNGHTPVEHALLLFTFCDEHSDGKPWTITAGSIKHIVTLLLPDLAEGQNPDFSLESTPCASYQPRGMPFKVVDPSRILAYDAPTGANEQVVRMIIHTDAFVHAKNLLSSARSDTAAHPRRIPWDAWGQEYARLFVANFHHYIYELSRPIHGERMIMQMTEAGEQTAYLMDFNRRAHRRQTCSEPGDTAFITEPSTLPPSLFANPVTTSLPYTAVRIPNADVYNGFLLDEQRLIGLKRSSTRAVQELDVFAF